MNDIQLLQRQIDELKTLIFQLILSDKYIFNKMIQILDGRNVQLGKGTGTKIGTETTQKLGFFGLTPVIQQTSSSQTPATFVANTSGILNDTATWGGYTVGDIVKILQVFGLIA